MSFFQFLASDGFSIYILYLYDTVFMSGVVLGAAATFYMLLSAFGIRKILSLFDK